MEFSSGRISEEGFKVTTGVMFGIAMMATAVRVAIRLFLDKRLRVDDYFLLASCAFLIAATGLLYWGTRAIFFVAVLSLNPAAILSSGLSQADILQQIIFFQKVNWAYLALSWTSIFAIKFGFLSFFRNLVDRIPFMYAYWKGVVIFTVLVFAFSVCDSFIACPKLGMASLECASTPQAIRKALALGATTISLDIVTDVLILMIPVSLIWRVQIKPRQKLGLALFLCLSICMIIIAIIRVSGLHYMDTFDNTWIFMWQQVEACVAVTMLSLTAFRSVFVSTKPSSNKARPWVPSTRRFFKKSTPKGQGLDDLTIPSGRLTGLTGFMGSRTQVTQSMSKNDTLTSDSWPPAVGTHKVAHSMDETTLNSDSWPAALEPHRKPSFDV